MLTTSERICLIHKLHFNDAVWVTLEIRSLFKFNHSMFSEKKTSDKAIPKMRRSSLGLLHSLRPYYTAI